MTTTDLLKRYQLKCLTQDVTGFHAVIQENPFTPCHGVNPTAAMLAAVVEYESLKYPKRHIRWSEWMGQFEMSRPGGDPVIGLDLDEMNRMISRQEGLSAYELLDLLDDQQDLPVWVGDKRVSGVKSSDGKVELELK